MNNFNAKFIKFILLFCFIIFFSLGSNSQTYGLKFESQDVTLDKRTELNLTPDNFLKFEDEFEISFKYKIDTIKPNSIFGYVFRIINLGKNNVDLLSTPNPYRRLNLVVGKTNTIIPVDYPVTSISSWIDLRIKFLLSEGKLIFYTPDSTYTQNNIGFKKQDEFKITFGANDYYEFKTTDVPSINIKDIKITEKGGLKYHWPLDETNGNIAKDKLRKHEAQIKNPVWLKQLHQSWINNYVAEIAGDLIVSVDNKNERIFMVGPDELLIYTAENGQIQNVKYRDKPLFLNNSYSSIYNPIDNKIYCYLVDNGSYHALDIETGYWNATGTISNYETKYKHHNRYFNASNNVIYLFGGYGEHKYNNEIIKIDLTKSSFEELTSNDTVFRPRYLAGLGVLNDTIYIFGGYGSETGNQMINPHSYYDLLGYSIKDGTLFKKFEVPRIIDDMTIANSMWIDSDSRDYYALVFEKSKFDGFLQLIKGNLNLPEIEKVGNKIPFQFLDVKSFASLFYMPKQKKLFVYTSYLSESNTTKVAIYSINYPPDKNEESLVTLKKSNGFTYLFMIFSMLLIIGTFILYYRKRKLKVKSVNDIANENNDSLNQSITSLEIKHDDVDFQIVFFGGFQVFDKELIDITNKFSPLLKELFLLIMLNTFKNNKGISSEKITEILWFDKSEKNARNNKAVNIAKLRNIIGEIGNCELTKKTGYWKIIADSERCKIDYLDFLNITSSRTNLTTQRINLLIKITEKGSFLHNVQYDWLDEFKASVSETIIDTLIEFAKSCDIKHDAEFIIHLADTVFNFDVVNEDAMILKCRAEYCMGKHSLAKATYEKFFKEYQLMYNQEYDQSYLKILQIGN